MAVELASSCPLPQAVAGSHDRHIMDDSVAENMRVLRSDRLKTAEHLQVAPYQATPVCGVITHHHAAGLNIPDDERPDEVRSCFPRFRWLRSFAAALL